MFNGIWPEPTNKRFNSAYLQIKYLFSRKIHSTRQNFYLFIISHHDVSEKKIFKNKKNRVRLSIVDFPAKPAKQKKQVALKKSLRLHTRGTPAAAAERVNKYFEKFFFFSKFLIWPSGLPRRQSLPQIAARWRYRLPSNNLTAHYNSQFFVSIHFDFDQEAQKCL